jgi:hypothetical protein
MQTTKFKIANRAHFHDGTLRSGTKETKTKQTKNAVSLPALAIKDTGSSGFRSYLFVLLPSLISSVFLSADTAIDIERFGRLIGSSSSALWRKRGPPRWEVS